MPRRDQGRYIKAFDPDVIAAMRKMEETIYELRSLREKQETVELGQHVKLLKTNRRRGGREAEGGGLLNRYRV